MFLSNEVKSQILANFNADGFVLIPDLFSKNEICFGIILYPKRGLFEISDSNIKYSSKFL